MIWDRFAAQGGYIYTAREEKLVCDMLELLLSYLVCTGSYGFRSSMVADIHTINMYGETPPHHIRGLHSEIQ